MREEHQPRLFYIADIFNNQPEAMCVISYTQGRMGTGLVAARIYALFRQAENDH